MVAGQHGTLCAPDGAILLDHSWFRGHADQFPELEATRTVRHLPGRALSLTTEFPLNYAHFILDALPRIAVIEKAGYELRSFDYVILTIPDAFYGSLVEMLGIERQRLVAPCPGLVLTSDVLVASTFPGMRRNPEPWAIEFLRARLGSPVRQGTRRLFLPRQSRKPVNQAALVSIAAAYGFETYLPETDPERQISLFEAAESVVAPHGAALANAAFCRPGTQVLELIPSDHVFPYYYTLCTNAGLRYSYLVGQSTELRDDNSIGPSPYDFHVDPDTFETAIRALVTAPT
jgi:capsular polysaccharide biosynthesis protein